MKSNIFEFRFKVFMTLLAIWIIAFFVLALFHVTSKSLMLITSISMMAYLAACTMYALNKAIPAKPTLKETEDDKRSIKND